MAVTCWLVAQAQSIATPKASLKKWYIKLKIRLGFSPFFLIGDDADSGHQVLKASTLKGANNLARDFFAAG